MQYYVYISIAGEDKISLWTMDPQSGKLTLRDETTIDGAPSPLAVDPGKKFLYAGLRSTRQLASFRIGAGGSLSHVQSIPLDADPCYLSTDRTGRYLLSAYYGAGMAAVHPIDVDGAAANPPVEWLSTYPKAHSIQTDASNRWAFLPHVGESNVILQFAFDEDTGHLTPNAVPQVRPPAGEGPRHYCFHPGKDILYFSNEQACSVTAYHFDPTAGTLAPFQTISTLPEGFDGDNTCAQIHIAPSGKYLYAPNRGHDSMACFAIDDTTGELTVIGYQPTEEVPRVFGIGPRGNYLYVAGQASGRLASYRIDAQSGALEPLAIYPVGERPMWVLIIEMEN